MDVRRRLAAFAVVLAIAFGAGFGLGNLVDDGDAPAPSQPAAGEPRGRAHDGHEGER